MRIYAGVSALSGRPYAGVGCGFSLTGRRRPTRKQAVVNLMAKPTRKLQKQFDAIDAKYTQTAEASYRAAALRGLKGLDAMLAAQAVNAPQDFAQ